MLGPVRGGATPATPSEEGSFSMYLVAMARMTARLTKFTSSILVHFSNSLAFLFLCILVHILESFELGATDFGC